MVSIYEVRGGGCLIYIEEKGKEDRIIRLYNYLVSKYDCKVVFFADSLYNDVDRIVKYLSKINLPFCVQEIDDIRKSIEYGVDSESQLKIGLKNFSHYTEDSWIRFYIDDRIIQINQLLDEGAELISDSAYEGELSSLL